MTNQKQLVLGVDTSAYTTSLALMSPNGRLLRDVRQTLDVPQGKRGLRQSEALYQHVRNLANGFDAAFSSITEATVAAVCVSTAPRPVDDSFMPVFLAGHGAAHTAAAVTHAPLWEASHQEGHLWSALWSLPREANVLQGQKVLVVHLSGGTTEALHVSGIGSEHEARPAISIVGATSDISAGQFIDRVGTSMGLPFPSGPHVQRLASQSEQNGSDEVVLKLPLAVQGSSLSFSGPESAAQRALLAGATPSHVARAVFDCIAASLAHWLDRLTRETGVRHVVMSGGVAASSLLREKMGASKRLAGLALWWAAPSYSSDNAVGLAAWGVAKLAGCSLLELPERGLT